MRQYTAAFEGAQVSSTNTLVLDIVKAILPLNITPLILISHSIFIIYMSHPYSNMCPGRFPSPTPSRETSPEPSIEPESPSVSPQHPAVSLNFTASNSFRKRPRFADSQSDPVLPRTGGQASTPTKSPPSARIRASDQRRASDPLQSGRQHRGRATLPQQREQRAFSAQSQPPSFTNVPRLHTTNQPSQFPVPESSRIDIELRTKLREPLTSKDGQGIIYVLRDLSRPHLGIKIGVTKRLDYKKRINEHQTTCKIVPEVIFLVCDVENSLRAEKLIHIELRDRRLLWECGGHKVDKVETHEEWFDITEEEAKMAAEKWTMFMNEQRPYDTRSKLSPTWSYLVQKRRLNVHTDHDIRREQWYSILAAPTHLEYYNFARDTLARTWETLICTLSRVWQWCRDFFWQMLTITYAFVTLMTFRNTFASIAFSLVSLCVCISIVQPKLSKRLRSKS
jgi:hypothetical protein